MAARYRSIVANCSAVREWDSNGTNFGYNPALGHTAGEFGHNDFYGVPLAIQHSNPASIGPMYRQQLELLWAGLRTATVK